MKTQILLENRELFQKRPGYWEFILTVDRLERPLEEIIQKADDVIPVPASPHAPVIENTESMQVNLAVIFSSMEALCPLTESRLAESWGAPGQPGSVEAIERVCAEILSHCRQLAGAELKILTTVMHPKLAVIQNKVRGITSENLTRLLDVVKVIRKFISEGGTGCLELEVRFSTERLSDLETPNLGFGEMAQEMVKPGNEGLVLRFVGWFIIGCLFWWAFIPYWIVREVFIKRTRQ